MIEDKREQTTEHAEDYESAVRSGRVVMAVRAADQAADEHATRIMNQHAARQVARYTQAL